MIDVGREGSPSSRSEGQVVMEAEPDPEQVGARMSRLDHQMDAVREQWADLRQISSVPGARSSLDARETTRRDAGQVPSRRRQPIPGWHSDF